MQKISNFNSHNKLVVWDSFIIFYCTDIYVFKEETAKNSFGVNQVNIPNNVAIIFFVNYAIHHHILSHQNFNRPTAV